MADLTCGALNIAARRDRCLDALFPDHAPEELHQEPLPGTDCSTRRSLGRLHQAQELGRVVSTDPSPKVAREYVAEYLSFLLQPIRLVPRVNEIIELSCEQGSLRDDGAVPILALSILLLLVIKGC